MVVCGVCGGEEFGEADGEYFCTICKTQSQDLRVMETEEEFSASFNYSLAIPSGPKQKVKTKALLQLHPWTCDEAFQMILSRQSEALLDLGFDARTRDLIFKLWCTFLSRGGAAFSDEDRKIPHRERDKWVGNAEKPRVKSAIRRKAKLKSLGFYDDDDMEVDNLLLGDEDEEENEENTEPTEVCFRTLLDRPLYMTLPTTLSICQIATMYSTDLVTCADIVKWVRDGKIPYNDARESLPEYIEMNAKDLCTYIPAKRMTARDLRTMGGKLLYELGVRELPPIDIVRLICRYSVELELPAEVNAMACALYRHTGMKNPACLSTKSRFIPCYEAIAIAFIIIVLQMLFGLDDVTEKRLSLFGKELEGSEPLFVWSEWMEYMDRKTRGDEKSLPTSYQGIKACDEKLFADAVSRGMSYGHKLGQAPRIIDRSSTRAALQNSLRTLIIRSDSRRKISSETLSDLYYDTPVKERVRPSKDFRHSSIKYITNPDKYKSFIGSGGFGLGLLDQSESESENEESEIPKAYETYSIQWPESCEFGRSESYKWLMDICCHVAGCDQSDVDMIKERVELVFFIDQSNPVLRELATSCRKRHVRTRYFN